MHHTEQLMINNTVLLICILFSIVCTGGYVHASAHRGQTGASPPPYLELTDHYRAEKQTYAISAALTFVVP